MVNLIDNGNNSRQVKVKDVIGLIPGWEKPTQTLKDDARKGWHV